MMIAVAVWQVLFDPAAMAQDREPAAPAPSLPAPSLPAPGIFESICLMIESAAVANNLPFEFFARLIWQESSFRPGAVGPQTRTGERAQGIAQFMPRTAAERGLLDPFDPVQALPKAAEFLRELVTEFGNIGLAAAAYNAGPRRVRDWLAGRGALPAETQAYVAAITGHSVEEWANGLKTSTHHSSPAQATCGGIMTLLRQKPSPFVEQLQRRVSKSVTSPWGVQVGAGFSRDRVLATYSSVERQHRLAGQDPVILQTTLRSRGTRPFYQVRIGADTRDGANNLCNRLRSGGIACMVLRNKPS